ncbi:MAG: hypothetical protein ACRCXL_10880 [Dermatophilaceae bacterium]
MVRHRQLAIDLGKLSPAGRKLFTREDVAQSEERLLAVGKSTIGWDTWDTSGWYTAGGLGLDAALTIATWGAGGAAKTSARAAAATRFARLLDHAGEVGLDIRTAAAAARLRLNTTLTARLDTLATIGDDLTNRLDALRPAIGPPPPRTLLDNPTPHPAPDTPTTRPPGGERDWPDLTSRGPGAPDHTTPEHRTPTTTQSPTTGTPDTDPTRPDTPRPPRSGSDSDAPSRTPDTDPGRRFGDQPDRDHANTDTGDGPDTDIPHENLTGHGDDQPGQAGGLDQIRDIPEEGIPDGAVPDAPDGGTTHDQYGRAYTFDHGGRRHLPGDPPNSHRDARGALHDPVTGRYATDPNTPTIDGYEFADRAKTYDATLDPNTQTVHDALVADRNTAYTAHQEALTLRNHLAHNAGINTKALDGSDSEDYIRNLVKQGQLDRVAAEHLEDAASDARDTRKALSAASERFGEETAAALARSRGETTLIGPSRAGAGRFDQATLAGDPPRITFYEAKGGNATLGNGRMVNGVRHQQGTTGYLSDVARVDSRFQDSLTRYLTQPDADPDLVRAITDGTIEIRYEMVQALPNGRIRVTPFKLDPNTLNLPGITP